MDVRTYLIGILLVLITIGLFGINYLLDNLEIEKSNNKILQNSITQQKLVIDKMKSDLLIVNDLNSKNSDIIDSQKRDYQELKDKFEVSKNPKNSKRDLGKIAIAKPKLVQNIVNKSTIHEFKCLEKITGNKGAENEICK